MQYDSVHGYQRSDVWFRLLWMIVFFFLLFYAVKLVVLVIAISQVVVLLVNGAPNERLREFSVRMNRYSFHILQYVTFNIERKPFPFSEFPDAD